MIEPIAIPCGFVYINDEPVEAFANVDESGCTVFILGDDEKPMVIGNISTNDIKAIYAVSALMESLNKSNYDALENTN